MNVDLHTASNYPEFRPQKRRCDTILQDVFQTKRILTLFGTDVRVFTLFGTDFRLSRRFRGKPATQDAFRTGRLIDYRLIGLSAEECILRGGFRDETLIISNFQNTFQHFEQTSEHISGWIGGLIYRSCQSASGSANTRIRRTYHTLHFQFISHMTSIC